jgi:hexosaminidase
MARGLASAAAFWLFAAPALAQAGQPTAPVVPQPLHVAPAAGPPISISAGSRLAVRADDPGALAAAQALRDLVRRTRGVDLQLQPGGAGAIRFSREPGFGPEAYRLEVGAGGARVAASDDAGLFYGAVTLWQLMTQKRGAGPVQLEPTVIDDAPRFRWRGLMIDSARHFQPVDEIERVLDAMAAHKLNVLHWHLTDDQGWRLEIKKYPRLTEVGAWRTPLPGSPDGSARYGGFYSQADVRRILAYAAARHVTVVPEIEMPGHAVSALLAYPQFGAGAPPDSTAQAMWGGFPNVYATDDRTLGFLEDVLTEVIALFPGPFIHVGGDEVAKERWNAAGSPDPAAQQQAFTHRIAAFLEAHHKRLVGWDEILDGGDLPADAVVTSWHGVAGGLAAARAGHDAVLAPAPVMYFDNRQALSRDAPPGRGWLVRLQDAYAFEPVPPDLPQDAARHILGLQGNVWTEMIRTDTQLEAMIFPRILAVAETGWSAPARKDWPGFASRLPAELSRLEGLGVRPDRSALAVLATATPAGAVALSAQAPGEIRYTLDGTDPTPTSALFGEPLAPARIKAALFIDGARAGPILERTPAGLARRPSQELKPCNDKLTLNLEGADHRTYFLNPSDACWTYTSADLGAARRITVAFARTPFGFGLDPAHNFVIVHPPRSPAGEVEVRPDTCLTDPLAVAPLPPGGPGASGQVTLALPPRTGRHDLCITFTGRTYDPLLAVDWVEVGP